VRQDCRLRADRTAILHHYGTAATFFSEWERLVLPLSFGFGQYRGHGHAGGARNRRMASGKNLTMAPLTASLPIGT